MFFTYVFHVSCSAVGQPVSSRPVDIRPQSQSPSTSPRSVSSYDSLEAAVRSHSSFTRYLGGKFISLYTFTVFISSLALIGLSVTSFVLYRDQSVSNMMDYVQFGASKFRKDVDSMISIGTRIQDLITGGVAYESITKSFESVASILRVHNDKFEIFSSSSLDAEGSKYRSNASDCSTSAIYTCADEADQADADSFSSQLSLLTEALSIRDNLLTEPGHFVNTTSNVPIPTIDQVFKAPDDSFYRLRLRMDDPYFNFSSDSFLSTNDGYGNVLLVIKSNGVIFSALGISSQDLSVVSSEGGNRQQVSGMSISAPDAALRMPAWVSAFSTEIATRLGSNRATYPVWFSNDDSRALMSDVPNTPFALIVGSSLGQSVFIDERLYWVLIATILVAILPVIGTFVIGSAYALRLVAVRRRKQMRATEIRDAELAILAIKESRLRKQGSVAQKR